MTEPMDIELSEIFLRNVKSVWKNEGEEWLNQLPNLLGLLSKKWALTDLKPISNMTYNFVAKALQGETHVITKVSCDKSVYEDECAALRHFDGAGSVKLLDSDSDYQAMLLTQCMPGISLKTELQNSVEEVILPYFDVAKNLRKTKPAESKFKHVDQWCKAIDRIKPGTIPKKYHEGAQQYRDYLLSTMTEEYVCHGDLHCDNVINHELNWLAIDPKGIVGEFEFELAAFDLLTDKEIEGKKVSQEIIKARITALANIADVSFERLFAWFYLRLVIGAQWFIEDGLDADKPLGILMRLEGIPINN